MKIGTRSLIFGAHCWFLHPWFVARAWIKLYGWPTHPAIWLAFLVHDIGYAGCDGMDTPEGEQHPRVGARIVGRLFGQQWHDFTLYHSRYLAKRDGQQYSRLCVADKLAFGLTPMWLYLPMVTLTGEIQEYLEEARKHHGYEVWPSATTAPWSRAGRADRMAWWRWVEAKMSSWALQHRDGEVDTRTQVRHPQADPQIAQMACEVAVDLLIDPVDLPDHWTPEHIAAYKVRWVKTMQEGKQVGFDDLQSLDPGLIPNVSVGDTNQGFRVRLKDDGEA